jgi:hypothetical protein
MAPLIRLILYSGIIAELTLSSVRNAVMIRNLFDCPSEKSDLFS